MGAQATRELSGADPPLVAAVLVVAALAPRPEDDRIALRAMVTRYSQWALGAVAAIAATGCSLAAVLPVPRFSLSWSWSTKKQ
jgi:putative copper export protein